MASYPFLYAAAASILPQLVSYELRRNFRLPASMNHVVMEWKQILSKLPSLIETLEFSKDPLQKKKMEGFLAIFKFVFDFHSNKKKYDWKSLVQHMTEFKDYYYYKTRKPIILRSSSEVNLDGGELDTSLTRALSSLKAPDVKPLDDLPPQLLPCLAYCALYPQGSTFVRETLIYQWVAEGFLLGDWHRDPSVGKQVKKGNLYFNMLLEKGVFVVPIFDFNGDAYKLHSYKMHPDIHSAVCGMASNEVLINPGTKKGSAAAVTTRYIALHKEDNAEIQSYEFPFQPTTFMCFIPEINNVTLQSLLSKFTELRVLHFAAQTQFEELPRELIDLRYLRYLALSRNTLLKSLYCSHFRELQTLAVDGCVNLEKVDARWTALEILQLSDCPKLKSFRAKSNDLEILHIFQCRRLESLPKVHSRRLTELICHECDSLDLDLRDCRGNSNYVEVVSLPKLIELKLGNYRSGSLLIANCSDLKSIDNHLHKSINSLETLRIYDCPNLEISPKVLSSMIKLTSIDIRNSPIIMATTFSNDAVEDLVPWIWNKDREFIIDGQRPTIQEVSLFEENDGALGSLIQSSSAQTSSYVPDDSSYFKLGLESSKRTDDSTGLSDSCATHVLTLISEIKRSPKWRLERLKLYCSHLFPDDFEFERDALVQLWMAQGLFLVPLEHFGYISFDHLFEEGFIIKTRTDILTGIDKYKINGEEATTLLNQDDSRNCFALIDDDNGLSGLDKSNCRHMSIVSKSISPKTLEALEGISELRTVLLIRDYGDSLKQIPSSFFEALTCMQALDLSGSHISELPSSIGNMTQLHFLDLSFTLLERIPESIAHLGELKTLKLKGCKRLHALPKGMKQLRSLRHLDFDILGQLTSMPKGMGQLTQLRTLTAFIVSEEDNCSSLGELKNLNKLGGSFCISGLEYASASDSSKVDMEKKKLTGLHLKWNDSISYDYDAGRNAHRVLMDICPAFKSLKEFKISSYPGPIVAPRVKDSRFVNLARLELISCKIEMFEAPDTLPNLKYLNITDMNGVKIIQGLHPGQRSDQKISFPKLETLIIDGMLNLESWTNIVKGDFPHLTKLSLMHCPKLTQLDDLLSILHSLTYLEISHCELFASLSSKPLPSLETLIINKCPALKKNYVPGKDGWKNIEHVPNIWIDMKGLGEKNQDTDSDDSDSSDEEIDHSSDSDKETGTSKDVSDDVTMM